MFWLMTSWHGDAPVRTFYVYPTREECERAAREEGEMAKLINIPATYSVGVGPLL